MKRIDSRGNPMFKRLKACLTGKGIREERLALVSGEKNVSEFLRSMPTACRALVTAPKQKADPPRGMEHIELHGDLFQEIDVLGTRRPLLWVDLPKTPQWNPEEGFQSPGLHLLVPFQDPENVGAVIRSAVAFNAASVILLEEAAHPFLPKSIRASAGAVFHAPLAHGPSIQHLPPSLPILALDMSGTPIDTVTFPPAFGLLPGLEGPGLPPALQERPVCVPMKNPSVDSLNAAGATAIALFVWSRSHAGS